MKNLIKWLIIAIISVAVFLGIYFLYGFLKDNYAPDPFAQGSESSSSSSSSAESEDIDYTAPDFTVFDENNNEVKLSDYFGKPIVLNFWATWCHYCKVEMPDFNNAYHDNPDVQFVMVNVTDGDRETVDIARAYIKDSGYDFPVLFDTQLNAANNYGASGLPMSVFIDKDGNLVTYAKGMLSEDDLKKGISMIK